LRAQSLLSSRFGHGEIMVFDRGVRFFLNCDRECRARATTRALALLGWLAAAMAACSSPETDGESGADSSGAGGSTSLAGGGNAGQQSTSGGAPAGTAGTTAGTGAGGTLGPAAGTGSGGASAGAVGALGGSAGEASAGAAGLPAAGSGGSMAPPVPDPTNLDHCLFGYDPLPSDDTMASGPYLFTPEGGGPVDTVVQPEVLEWLTDNQWMGAHVVWHAVRGCNIGTAAGLLQPLGFPDICREYPVLVPKDQTCRTAGDGYQFLLFHRHMIQALKQLWPKHAADFDGFDRFPTTKEELPEIWNDADPDWTAQILEAAEIADNIEQHLDKFPDEGSVGYWLQCPVGTAAPGFAPQMPYIGLHFNLHDEWSRGSSSAHGLNNGQVNITNYMFWKLHGWIDKVWEKYRVAKGLAEPGSAAMQKHKQDLAAQCREMEIEIEILRQTVGEGPLLDCPPDVDETGYFHTTVRPIFETEANHCAACHGPAQTSPYAGLTLGGQISSQCVLERLERQSNDGGQFKLIEPGDPERSWLYLKASGLAATAGCTSVDANKPCNSATMPPSGRTMTDEELAIIHQWILDGANP
jgi:hypothetical protein